MKIKACLAFTALSIALTGASASAATFEYSAENPTTKFGSAGSLEKVSTSFNDATDLFTWSSTFSPTADGAIAKGAWLVVNDGPKPSKNIKENVIFYLDGLNSQVSAYEYDASKKAGSWRTTTRLGQKALNVEHEGENRTFSFSWDMTEINQMFGSPWKGTAFDENIGIWMHGLATLDTDYDADGNLSKFVFGKSATKTAFDISNDDTVTLPDEPVVISPGDSQDVPEPGMLIALGITAVAATFSKSRECSTAA